MLNNELGTDNVNIHNIRNSKDFKCNEKAFQEIFFKFSY